MKRFSKLIAVVLLLLIQCEAARPTLILMIYNDDAIYFGSDSEVSNEYAPEHGLAHKIFQLENTCCVSINGVYGGRIEEISGKISLLFLPEVLKSTCDDASNPIMSLDKQITNVVSTLDSAYKLFMLTKLDKSTNNSETRLSFCGYDNDKKSFFGSSVLLDGTNQVTLDTFFERGQSTIGGTFTPMGEIHFAINLVYETNHIIADLLPKGSMQILSDIQNEKPLSENVIKDFMLSLFDAHHTYASTYSTDKGLVGEPYFIYKITKTNTALIHD